MADIFSRAPLNIEKPITSDMVLLHWAGSGNQAGAGVIIGQATNFSLQYQQPITRRWTLGGSATNTAVIYGGRPAGTLQMQRLFVDQNEDLFGQPGWNICNGTATITIQMDGTGSSLNCTTSTMTYTAYGCVVTSYGLTAEADGLTVVDNITIELMQLDYSNGLS